MDLFADIVGQPQATGLLMQALSRRRIAPAYLLTGPAGVGKRITAERFALALLALDAVVPDKLSSNSLDVSQPIDEDRLRQVSQQLHPDLLWVAPTYMHQGQRLTVVEAEQAGLKRRSPPQIRLEQVRELTQFLGRPPLQAPRSVVVIDGAEAMAEAAANALLKTLEEPGTATLLLICHSRDLLLPTLISRCQTIPFQRLDSAAMVTVLQKIGADALLQRSDLLAMAQGSPGRAIAALQQWNEMPEDILQASISPPNTLRQALSLARSIASSLDVEVQLWLVDYLQHRYYDATVEPLLDSSTEASGARQTQPAASWCENRHRLQILERARQQLQRYVQPRLVWEVALMALAGSPPR